jgi:kynurenine formamidase
LRPDKLTITAAEVVYQKRNLNLIGTDTITIPLSRVASVKVDRKLINAEITIYSTGNKEVVVKNFSVGDARKIKSEIERRLS